MQGRQSSEHPLLDALNKRVDEHLQLPTEEDAAASKIQLAWRHYYRATRLHRTDTLFGANSRDARWNRCVIPKIFRNFASQQPLKPVFTTCHHTSRNLDQILHDGVLYPKSISNIQGIGVGDDVSRHDNHLVFTSVEGIYSTGGRLKFSIPDLLKNQDGNLVYFKLFDWAVGNDTVIQVTDRISMRLMEYAANKPSFRFSINRTEYMEVSLPGESMVYHGFKGLNEYVTFLIFKIVAAMPDTAQGNTIRNEIYNYFSCMNHAALANHLYEIAKDLCENAEFDFISQLKLSFHAIKEIYYDNRLIRIDNLIELVREKNFEAVENFMLARIGSAFNNSFFMIKGLLDYAEACQAKKIGQWLRNRYKEILQLPILADGDGLFSDEDITLDFSSFKLISGSLGSNQDAGVYTREGKKYYLKFYPNEDQARVEVLAAKFYRFGVEIVPEAYLVKRNPAPHQSAIGVALEWIPDLSSISRSEIKFSEIRNCHEGFIFDAWLANWDVVGQEYDNLCLFPVDGGHLTVRIDFGGTLHFRAMGKFKTGFLGSKEVEECETLKHPHVNPNGASIFKDISVGDLKVGALALNTITDNAIIENVQFCFPGKTYARFRGKLIETLVGRRDFLLEKYRLTLNDPIELLASAIQNRYHGFCLDKMKHGMLHASRVAVYVAAMASLYRQQGYEITDREVKLMQIAALFHDTGRERDEGGDGHEWELVGRRYCFDTLKYFGVAEKEAILIADSITDKDKSIANNKSLYAKLLQNADCLDVIRSHNWIFDCKYMDFIREFPDSRAKLTDFLRDCHLFVAATYDLKRYYSGWGHVHPTWDEPIKKRYELSKTCFADILEKARDLQHLFPLYRDGIAAPSTKKRQRENGAESEQAQKKLKLPAQSTSYRMR